MGDRAGYALRDAGNLTTVKTRKVKVYKSFVPKTVSDCNNLDQYSVAYQAHPALVFSLGM